MHFDGWCLRCLTLPWRHYAMLGSSGLFHNPAPQTAPHGPGQWLAVLGDSEKGCAFGACLGLERAGGALCAAAGTPPKAPRVPAPRQAGGVGIWLACRLVTAPRGQVAWAEPFYKPRCATDRLT